MAFLDPRRNPLLEVDFAHFNRKPPLTAGKLHFALGFGRHCITGRRPISPRPHRLQHSGILVRSSALDHHRRMNPSVRANHKAHCDLTSSLNPIEQRIRRRQRLRRMQSPTAIRRPAAQDCPRRSVMKRSPPHCSFPVPSRHQTRLWAVYRGQAGRPVNRQDRQPSSTKHALSFCASPPERRNQYASLR